MSDRTRREAWILLLLGIAAISPAHADGPRAGFKRHAEDTFISPDKKVRGDMQGEETPGPMDRRLALCL
jgi:hypothetical protein